MPGAQRGAEPSHGRRLELAEQDTVVVFSGGARVDARLLGALPAGARVVGADRGAEVALALGLRVDVAVGDFDSIGRAALEALEHSGARLDRHPRDKDATDLELALDAALAFAPRRILVVGGVGGRLDHVAGELLLLGAPRYAGVEIDAHLGRASAHVVRGERRLDGAPGELVSLLALHGDARGVVTEGLAYPLAGATLEAGSTRGVSNVFDASVARIAVGSGALLALRPGRRASTAELRSARRSAAAGSASS